MPLSPDQTDWDIDELLADEQEVTMRSNYDIWGSGVLYPSSGNSLLRSDSRCQGRCAVLSRADAGASACGGARAAGDLRRRNAGEPPCGAFGLSPIGEKSPN